MIELHIPEWLAAALTTFFLGLVSSVIGGFVWIIKLGSRVSALEKNDMTSQKQLIEVTKQANDTVVAFTTKLAEAREQALMTFASEADFKRLEDKVDDLRDAVASLAPAPVKKSRQVRRRASSADGE